MINFVLAAAIAIAAAGVIFAWLTLRARKQARIPSLNSLRDVNRRGAQRTTIRARTDRSNESALEGMISDLK